ncbi:MAG: hypothetical protein ACPG5U_08340, partial [Planktomarina sp.]
AVTASDHGCPGKDVALRIAEKFAYGMVVQHDWTLSKSANWSMKTFSLNVASPVGPMRARFGKPVKGA